MEREEDSETTVGGEGQEVAQEAARPALETLRSDGEALQLFEL